MTAAINSRSSVFSTPSADEAPSAAPAVPAKPSTDNRVEAWSGRALKGAPTADAVLAQLDTKMRKGEFQPLRDFWVTEQQARESVALLGELSPKDYQQAINEMSSATMRQLLSEMDPETRATFFKQAQAKGVLTELPSVKAARTEGSPPDAPALLRNDRSLPAPLREAIHAENTERTAQYMKAFEGYIGRYSDAALTAKSPLALRMMGPPAREFLLQEPGVTYGDPVVKGTLNQGMTQREPAAHAANDRISDFAGRRRAGSFTVTGEAKFAAEAGGYGVESNAQLSITDYGKVTGKNTNEGQVKLVPGVAVGLTSEGRTFTELGTKDNNVRLENGRLVELEGKAGVLGVKLTEDKTTLSMKALGAVPIGGFATIDEKHGAYGGGLKAGGELEFGSLKVEASLKLGVTVQGVAPERLPMIASMCDDGIWGPMPELDGTKWDAIPEARRRRLASDGWTKGNWPVK